MTTFVLFPTSKGRAVTEAAKPTSFVARVRTSVPDAVLMPILNNAEQALLEEAAGQAQDLGMDPIVSASPQGLLGALREGYDHALRRASPDDIFVRMDTAEHPPESIPRLIKAVEQVKFGVVIGDLDFSNGKLVAGSLDEWVHLQVFPELYGQATRSKLPLSCAHGFQVFNSRATLERTFYRALSIIGEVERELRDHISWGFDGAMAIAASQITTVRVEKIPAETLRNREPEKIMSQLAAAMRIVRAAERLSR